VASDPIRYSLFAIRFIPGSSNGRMRRSERRDVGSSPTPGSNIVAVTGEVTAAPAKRVNAGSSPARNSNMLS
jgi:hypothetical protein